ncbi:acetyl/propionyl/methylcrotonyl-CoA carboxylase subunit alpha [Micromonospora sp. NPDC048830]|uniref:acetyl-CoA carboxylase biotin carboxylase subunit n=1 Tax=Micromonospora sp. NPDC048830 TaxID=3364257 RepID=UPI00370FFA84
MFDTVLIANRGEIAVRVARTCREMGIRTVAVYATPDRESAVVRQADRAVHLGPSPLKRSYLNIPAVIEAARITGAQAIHPGYGFLSEDPDFAEICAANGMTFIGPPPSVMSRLGDKALARSLLARAGLPVLPGSPEPVEHLSTAQEIAAGIGYPVIIKAVAGGGGRGMRMVRRAAEFARAYQEVRATAQAVFGDGRVYLERYLESARHVEVQVLCDRHGNAVHLGDRDCSVQRRHQKLIEEAPAPGLSESLAARMAGAAVTGALSVGYVGVGTFEFLVDGEDFYLMEVNCRIQVEHPVTEMVTGIDLVRQQLLVAAGEPLTIGQSDVVIRGAAIECRVNAEDASRGFVPAPGLLEVFEPPAGPFIRVDTHGYPGYRVPPNYDSLLAKAVVWAPDRPQAMARMVRALDEFRIAGPGVRTSIDFVRTAINDPRFRAAEHDTTLTDRILATGG